jgi:hypothetical protein
MPPVAVLQTVANIDYPAVEAAVLIGWVEITEAANVRYEPQFLLKGKRGDAA